MSELQNRLNSILNEKTNKIIPNNIKNGVTIFNITGNLIESNEEPTITVDPSTQVINLEPNSGYTGISNVVINAVTSNICSNITAENIRNGVNILGIVGANYIVNTADANAQAINMRSGVTAYVNGTKLVGNLPVKTYEPGYSFEQTFINGDCRYVVTKNSMNYFVISYQVANQNEPDSWMFEGNRKMKLGMKDSLVASTISLTADKLAKGKKVLSITGTYTSDANAVASDIALGKTAYVNGVKVVGTANTSNLEPTIQEQANIISNLYNSINALNAELENKCGMSGNQFVVPNGMKFGFSERILSNGSDWDVSHVEDMWNLFNSSTNLNNVDVSNWDIHNVSSISSMFNVCSNIVSLNTSAWNTANIKKMGRAFNGCTKLKTLDVSNWNTSNVQSCGNIFYSCRNITQLDVSNWNMSQSTNILGMFGMCSNLTTIDVSNWTLNAQVTNLWGLFSACNNLSDASINSIINMCLNASQITVKNLSNTNASSPFNFTNIGNSKYQSRWSELTAAGWTY